MPRPSPMADLYTRLSQAGFPDDYVRECVLPDWWDDDLAFEEENRLLAEMAIARTFKIPLTSLADATAPLPLGDERTARFRRWRDADKNKLLPTVVIARRVCELVLSCADVPDMKLDGVSAKALRTEILRTQDYVTLTPLVQHCWRLGVPVVHLKKRPAGARRLDGLALMVSGRPCIALAGAQPSPAWLAWPLAHEIGHVACGHLASEDVIDVHINLNDVEAPSEKEANAYAKTLIYGSVHRFHSNEAIDASALAREASELGRKHKIHPASVITNYGFNMQDYRVANAALKILGVADGGAQAVRHALGHRLDLDRLSSTDRQFLLNVTGLVEQ